MKQASSNCWVNKFVSLEKEYINSGKPRNMQYLQEENWDNIQRKVFENIKAHFVGGNGQVRIEKGRNKKGEEYPLLHEIICKNFRERRSDIYGEKERMAYNRQASKLEDYYNQVILILGNDKDAVYEDTIIPF